MAIFNIKDKNQNTSLTVGKNIDVVWINMLSSLAEHGFDI